MEDYFLDNSGCYSIYLNNTEIAAPLHLNEHPSCQANKDLREYLKTGEVSLARICKASKNFLDNKKGTINKSCVEGNLKCFIANKTSFYKDSCWLPTFRIWLSTHFGSIALANKLIQKIKSS